MITSTVFLVCLIVLPMFYIHLTICLATVFIYREAYSICPKHQMWPKFYHGLHPTQSHFVRLFLRPWETIPRIGTTRSTELVIIKFALPHPHTKLNPKIHTHVDKKHCVTLN